MKKLPWILLTISFGIIIFLLFKMYSPAVSFKSYLLDNKYTLESHPAKIDYDKVKKDLVEINNWKEYLIALKNSSISKILPDTAQKYHDIFKNNKNSLISTYGIPATHPYRLDGTRAVLFELDTILAGIVRSFEDLDFVQPDTWREKGFLVYFSNYGTNADPLKTKQNSAILQFCEYKGTQGSVENWKVIENEMYNFGNLRPPKINVLEEQIK